MYSLKNMAMSIILSVSLFTTMIMGPMASLNDGMHILEFGTSNKISKQLGDDNKIIDTASPSATDSVETPASLASQNEGSKTGTPVKTSGVKATSSAVKKASPAPAPKKGLSADQQAKEIAEGTPLDLKAATALVKYARKYDLNPSLILSVISVESNFNQYEVGSSRDRGYMQIIPATEKWLATGFGKELGLKYNPNRIFDPEYNIGLAAAYLNDLKSKHNENYHAMLSEYNRGSGNLKKYFKKNRTYSTSYSRKVLSREKQYQMFNK